MINALGLLEVDGMVAAVDAADAMLKAANVRRVVQRWMPEAQPQRVQDVLSAARR